MPGPPGSTLSGQAWGTDASPRLRRHPGFSSGFPTGSAPDLGRLLDPEGGLRVLDNYEPARQFAAYEVLHLRIEGELAGRDLDHFIMSEKRQDGAISHVHAELVAAAPSRRVARETCGQATVASCHAVAFDVFLRHPPARHAHVDERRSTPDRVHARARGLLDARCHAEKAEPKGRRFSNRRVRSGLLARRRSSCSSW